jgi:hypothetical protein
MSYSASSRSQAHELDIGKEYSEGERVNTDSCHSHANSGSVLGLGKESEIPEVAENLAIQTESIDLKKILLQNREALSRRGLQRLENNRSQGSRILRKDNGRLSGPLQPHTMEERWNYYVNGLDPQFFDPKNKDAALQSSSERIECGEVSYRGVTVNHENCNDVKFVFRSRWEAKALCICDPRLTLNSLSFNRISCTARIYFDWFLETFNIIVVSGGPPFDMPRPDRGNF